MAKKHNFLKWYTKTLKSGKVRRYAREKGRYKKWEDADTLDRPEGEYRIMEIIVNYTPTKGSRSVPSSGTNFEVRLRIPEDEYDKGELQELGEDALREQGFSDYMIESCSIDHKSGKDIIGYSDSDKTKYMIVDLTRPQFKYPKRKGEWGTLGEEEIDE